MDNFQVSNFNFSREFFKTYGISNFKSNNAPHFSCKTFPAKNLSVREDCNLLLGLNDKAFSFLEVPISVLNFLLLSSIIYLCTCFYYHYYFILIFSCERCKFYVMRKINKMNKKKKKNYVFQIIQTL